MKNRGNLLNRQNAKFVRVALLKSRFPSFNWFKFPEILCEDWSKISKIRKKNRLKTKNALLI